MKFNIPEYKPSTEIAEILKKCTNADEFDVQAKEIIVNFLCDRYFPDDVTYQTLIRQIREKACEFHVEDNYEHLTIDDNMIAWSLPKPLIKQSKVSNASLLNFLPKVLKDYVKAVSEFGQVPVEMCILPMLSVLALCVQGKAKVKDHNSSFNHELTMYTITVAPSGKRKSPALKHFIDPVIRYQEDFNKNHSLEIQQRKTEREFLENQKQGFIKGKNRNLDKAKEIDEQLEKLPIIRKKSYIVTDVTPEALTQAIYEQNGKIGIMDDEGGVLDTFSGLYSNGKANIDVILKSYTGEHIDVRRSKSNTVIELNRPLLSIGILTQPEMCEGFINNAIFDKRGLTSRFLYSFPKTPDRYVDEVPEIPETVKHAYYKLINRLLEMSESDTIICHTYESIDRFHDFFEYMQNTKESGHIFVNKPEYAEKQFANALKIAALLHLCEHEPTERISGDTANNAINIMMWCCNQAYKAFEENVIENPEVAMANKIIDKLYDRKRNTWHSQRDLRTYLNIRKRTEKDDIFMGALEILLDCNYIQTNGKKLDEQRCKLILNPIIKPIK